MLRYLSSAANQKRKFFLDKRNLKSLEYFRSYLEQGLEELNRALLRKKKESARKNDFKRMRSEDESDKLLSG